ncbi:10529_t:CDS:2 [Dentiscutata heterogama]|uniref:10529_t:CDS:1 n=1 Tax=Dentiscutata heterogama TaxID=1316150 RepID=A0ACA9LSL6_9GLOM|nr:10529_t:CDS:2 [Dentiscutata heterogama]
MKGKISRTVSFCREKMKISIYAIAVATATLALPAPKHVEVDQKDSKIDCKVNSDKAGKRDKPSKTPNPPIVIIEPHLSPEPQPQKSTPPPQNLTVKPKKSLYNWHPKVVDRNNPPPPDRPERRHSHQPISYVDQPEIERRRSYNPIQPPRPDSPTIPTADFDDNGERRDDMNKILKTSNRILPSVVIDSR